VPPLAQSVWLTKKVRWFVKMPVVAFARMKPFAIQVVDSFAGEKTSDAATALGFEYCRLFPKRLKLKSMLAPGPNV
jgi:hypothetical protein